MDLQQLKYFQTVARIEHMTRAAEQLNISQPALSKSIAQIEEAINIINQAITIIEESHFDYSKIEQYQGWG